MANNSGSAVDNFEKLANESISQSKSASQGGRGASMGFSFGGLFENIIAQSPEILFPILAKFVMSALKNPESKKGKILKPLAIAFASAVIERFPESFVSESE